MYDGCACIAGLIKRPTHGTPPPPCQGGQCPSTHTLPVSTPGVGELGSKDNGDRQDSKDKGVVLGSEDTGDRQDSQDMGYIGVQWVVFFIAILVEDRRTKTEGQ